MGRGLSLFRRRHGWAPHTNEGRGWVLGQDGSGEPINARTVPGTTSERCLARRHHPAPPFPPPRHCHPGFRVATETDERAVRDSLILPLQVRQAGHHRDGRRDPPDCKAGAERQRDASRSFDTSRRASACEATPSQLTIEGKTFRRERVCGVAGLPPDRSSLHMQQSCGAKAAALRRALSVGIMAAVAQRATHPNWRSAGHSWQVLSDGSEARTEPIRNTGSVISACTHHIQNCTCGMDAAKSQPTSRRTTVQRRT
jgi:hypothetical protein